MTTKEQRLAQAFSLFQQKRIVEAEAIFSALIAQHPDYHDALHYFGILKASTGRRAEAKAHLERSLATRQNYIPYSENYASILYQFGDYEDAAALCSRLLKAIKTNETLQYVLAISLLKSGRLQESALEFERLITLFPRNAAAHNERGTVLARLGHLDLALASVEKALAISPSYTEALLNQGNILAKLNKHDHAIETFRQAIGISPSSNNANIYIGLGNACKAVRRYDEALSAYEAALSLSPGLAEAWAGRGNLFCALKRYGEALIAFDKALSIDSKLAEAWLGRGNAQFDLKSFDEAEDAYSKALAIEPNLAEAHLGRANVLVHLKRYEEALSIYQRALSVAPELAGAWLGHGNALFGLGRYAEAAAAYDKVIASDQELAEAWLGRGNLFYALKRPDESLSAFDRALSLDPNLAGAWLGRGSILFDAKRVDDALVCFDKALALDPDQVGLEGARLSAKMHLSNWENLEPEIAHLRAAVRCGKINADPFTFIALGGSAEDHLFCAKSWVSTQHPASAAIRRSERYDHEKIRLGYVSSDFRSHAVAGVIAGVLERHDRTSFQTTAISLGPDDKSSMRQRLKGAFDQFVDCGSLSDAQIAELIAKSEIDILVDLNGFTKDGRPNIFAARPAPVQVSYLGYLSTMGARFIDYIIADRIVIPEDQRKYYQEKVVYLPDGFLSADRESRTFADLPTRMDAGLPGEGTIFCCFNTNYKINPSIFDTWMRILNRVERSVLWISVSSAAAAENLRKEASKRGVDPGRLLFAPVLSMPDHLSRSRLADIFLDTLPYNAGATCCDMLWAGVPVLTQIGEAFVGRMAASLLSAIGLPELITTSPQEYENTAVHLATHPEKLAEVKRKLEANRLTTALFDNAGFVRQLEAAYRNMHRRHQSGLPPDHLEVVP